MARLQLRRARDRLELRGFTFTGVHHHAEIVLGAQLALIAQTGLGLPGIFAGIYWSPRGDWRGLSRHRLSRRRHWL
jgi:hypothetical protein